MQCGLAVDSDVESAAFSDLTLDNISSAHTGSHLVPSTGGDLFDFTALITALHAAARLRRASLVDFSGAFSSFSASQSTPSPVQSVCEFAEMWHISVARFSEFSRPRSPSPHSSHRSDHITTPTAGSEVVRVCSNVKDFIAPIIARRPGPCAELQAINFIPPVQQRNSFFQGAGSIPVFASFTRPHTPHRLSQPPRGPQEFSLQQPNFQPNPGHKSAENRKTGRPQGRFPSMQRTQIMQNTRFACLLKG